MIPLLLTGPAGSGKTFRCLTEIAARLREAPEGAPLLMIAPRQATYQLERQILSLPGMEGFTRLRILSFQRLAQFVFEATGRAEPKLLDEQGRIMVLRAILGRQRGSLQVYGQSAHRDGLAQELSLFWRELCEHNIGPDGLRAAAGRVNNQRLAAKLRDFGEIFGQYTQWLDDHQLRDGDELLDLAAAAALKGPMPSVGGLWLDGFAQMTPQERRLLNAILRHCQEATLAFCLPERPRAEADSFSMWGVMSQTYSQLSAELQQIFQAAPREETLTRRKEKGRFDAASALAHLEERWAKPCAFEGDLPESCVHIVKCPNLEAEAVFTARQILKFVRAGGHFREAAVLARSLNGVHDVVQRVFHRFGIPCFTDRRELVAHHPLAELTRGALRTIAFGCGQRDLFVALKSGLIGVAQGELDWFENMALARGWHGESWRGKLACGPRAGQWEMERAEQIRKLALRPIFQLQKKLGPAPSGLQMAGALRDFWTGLDVEAQLEKWAEEDALHATVWAQMEDWLKSIELAFADDSMPLNEWLAIVEAGLGSLTVGLIPPKLDQTLIGAVDRSRNPDLKAVFLLGLNEGIFPKPGKERLLMNDSERVTLAEAGVHLGMTSVWNLGAEQFYGYIACTRARESLTATFSETGADGDPLNPSSFIAHFKRLFPKLEITAFATPQFEEAESAHELHPALFSAARNGLKMPFSDWPALKEASARARMSSVQTWENLTPETIAGLYGKTIRTSVSKLEQFAMCPFRFFVSSGLRAEERLVFELDRREEGSFQHEILAEFHRRVAAMGKRWRDLSPVEGSKLVAEIAASMKKSFQEGLVEATPANRFKAEAKTAALREFIQEYLALMRDCRFDPKHVELGFGHKGSLPVWVVQVGEDRALEFSGRVDRVDIWLDEAAQRCYVAVFDYKSSERKLDRRMVENAIQQQLPAYLAALEKVGKSTGFPYEVKAAGAFYVNLRLKVKRARTRTAAMNPGEAKTSEDFKQFGVFDWEMVDRFDPKRAGELFDYSAAGPRPLNHFKALERQEFAKLLSDTEERLRVLGKRIFDGDLRMEPYRYKNDTPCARCFYSGICRIDPWTHHFKTLPAPCQ